MGWYWLILCIRYVKSTIDPYWYIDTATTMFSFFCGLEEMICSPWRHWISFMTFDSSGSRPTIRGTRKRPTRKKMKRLPTERSRSCFVPDFRGTRLERSRKWYRAIIRFMAVYPWQFLCWSFFGIVMFNYTDPRALFRNTWGMVGVHLEIPQWLGYDTTKPESYLVVELVLDTWVRLNSNPHSWCQVDEGHDDSADLENPFFEQNSCVHVFYQWNGKGWGVAVKVFHAFDGCAVPCHRKKSLQKRAHAFWIWHDLTQYLLQKPPDISVCFVWAVRQWEEDFPLWHGQDNWHWAIGCQRNYGQVWYTYRFCGLVHVSTEFWNTFWL